MGSKEISKESNTSDVEQTRRDRGREDSDCCSSTNWRILSSSIQLKFCKRSRSGGKQKLTSHNCINLWFICSNCSLSPFLAFHRCVNLFHEKHSRYQFSIKFCMYFYIIGCWTSKISLVIIISRPWNFMHFDQGFYIDKNDNDRNRFLLRRYFQSPRNSEFSEILLFVETATVE